MRAFLVIATFAIGFCLAWIAVLTLGQEAFHQRAVVRIFFWPTPAIPIYIYLAATFAAGLLIGLATTVYTWLAMAGKVRAHKRTARELGETVDSLKSTIQQAPPSTSEEE